MAELEGVPQWKRDLIRRRRGAPAGPGGPAQGGPAPAQSAARRGPADMLLQAPAHYRLPEPLDYGEPRQPGVPPDSGEELTYGPGIVKKLKSRYLSLTLREAGGRARPALHALRRAASLEHVLDEPSTAPAQGAPRLYLPRAQARPARYRQHARVPEASKRARSVDALVRRDSRSGTEEPPSPPPSPPAPPPAPAPSPALRPLRPPPLLREAERPPPDLVKHALKIFEGAPGKRTKTPTLTGQVADKVKSFTDQRGKTEKGGRPAVPPRGPPLSPDRRPLAVATQTTQTTPSLLARPPPSPKKLPPQDADVRDRSASPVRVIERPVTLAKSDMSPVKTEFRFAREEPKSPPASPGSTPPASPERSPPERPPAERNGALRTSTPEPRTGRPASAEVSLVAPHLERDSDSDSSSEDEAVFEVNGEDAPTAEAAPDGPPGEPQYPRGGHNGVSDDGGARVPHLSGARPPALVAFNKVKVPEIENKHKVPESPVTPPPPAPRVPAAFDAKIASPVAPVPAPDPSPPAPRDPVPSVTTKKIDAIPSPVSPPKERSITVLKQRKDPSGSPALVHYHSPSPPQQLTSREIEKNLINTTKSLEQPLKKVTVTMLDSPDSRTAKRDTERIEEKRVSILETKKQVQIESGVILLDVKEIVVNEVMSGSEVIKESRSVETSVAIVSNGISPARVGGRKPHWQHQENTMVFNFSNRKEVPDYVENDGIILRSSKREKPKVNNDVISLAGLGGESCTDGGANGNESGDEDWTGRPPSPCDVAFENDNVVINGRSNIAAGKTRTKLLKIQFDESLTTTFEYPSEASLGEEVLTTPASAAPPASPLASGGSLSTYTPSKVSLQADSFQLGVTRTQSQPGSERARNGNANVNTTNGDAASSLEDSSGEMNSLDPSKGPPRDYLKPCQEGDSHNWSHETHQGDGDLLF